MDAAEVEALKAKVSSIEVTAEKLRKAAAHWKGQHGKLKEQMDAASAAKQAEAVPPSSAVSECLSGSFTHRTETRAADGGHESYRAREGGVRRGGQMQVSTRK